MCEIYRRYDKEADIDVTIAVNKQIQHDQKDYGMVTLGGLFLCWQDQHRGIVLLHDVARVIDQTL